MIWEFLRENIDSAKRQPKKNPRQTGGSTFRRQSAMHSSFQPDSNQPRSLLAAKVHCFHKLCNLMQAITLESYSQASLNLRQFVWRILDFIGVCCERHTDLLCNYARDFGSLGAHVVSLSVGCKNSDGFRV